MFWNDNAYLNKTKVQTDVSFIMAKIAYHAIYFDRLYFCVYVMGIILIFLLKNRIISLFL